MKNVRNIVAAGVLSLAMGVTSMTVFAAAKYDSPQEALSEMTGKTVEQIVEKRAEENKSYGAIALEEGILDEFKAERAEQKKEAIQERVTEGNLGQEEADQIMERIQEHQEACVGERNIGEGMMQGYNNEYRNGSRDRRGNGHGLRNSSMHERREGFGNHERGLGQNR